LRGTSASLFDPRFRPLPDRRVIVSLERLANDRQAEKLESLTYEFA
jgi:hypothetical protein